MASDLWQYSSITARYPAEWKISHPNWQEQRLKKRPKSS